MNPSRKARAVTVETTAAEIAARWVDESKRHRLELDILRHMEHHIRVEAEACAKIADERELWAKQMHSQSYGAAMARHIAEQIRARNQR